MKSLKHCVYIGLIFSNIILAGCSHKVGSKAWCKDMNEKPTGEWSVNEATEYAQNCLFKADN